MNVKVQTRNNYLDWLRVLGIMLVFIYHTSRLYNVEDWVVKNNIWYPAVEVWNKFSTSFMMPLMFVISGASLFYALGKGGFGKFLKDKVLRLLVPLFVADLTGSSIQAYLNASWHHLFNGNYLQYLPRYYHLNTIHWMGDHLYYLLVLFIYSVLLYPLLHWLRGGGSPILSKLAGALSKSGVVYLLAVPIGITYIVLPSGSLLMQTNGGWPYIAYFWFTLWGFLVVSDTRLQDWIRRMRWMSLAVGLALVMGFIILYSRIADPDVMTPALILAGMLRTIGGWMCVLAIFGLGMQYLTTRSPHLDYANEAVLPFYILHQTVIVTVASFILPLGIPDLPEWAAIALASFGISLAIYQYLVRRWNVMRFLFGMKPLTPRSAKKSASENLALPMLDR
ncbi:MAG: acyltransferase family protein [Anaerolineaceae bacterium]|nr:acyltransferase family protein [Anaerolineaceae bacterium]